MVDPLAPRRAPSVRCGHYLRVCGKLASSWFCEKACRVCSSSYCFTFNVSACPHALILSFGYAIPEGAECDHIGRDGHRPLVVRDRPQHLGFSQTGTGCCRPIGLKIGGAARRLSRKNIAPRSFTAHEALRLQFLFYRWLSLSSNCTGVLSTSTLSPF